MSTTETTQEAEFEPGAMYQDPSGTPWRRTGDGRWIVPGAEGVYPDNAPSQPLRRLVPEDLMWETAYMDVQAVLDKALGTEEEDGAGAGIAADVALLAGQRDEARAEVAELRRTIRALQAARMADATEEPAP